MFSVCSHPGVPSLAGGTYLGQGVPTLARGVPTLVRGVPTLARGTYLGQEVPTLDGVLDTLWSVCLLRSRRRTFLLYVDVLMF